MMTDFNNYKLSFEEAKNIIEFYDSMNDDDFTKQIAKWAQYEVPLDSDANIYETIRKDVVDTFRKVLQDNENQINYNVDLQVGLKLYELLDPQKGFDLIKANDDDIWRYISVKVMPDLTFIRYPNLDSDVEELKKYFPGLSYPNGIKTEKDSGRLKKKRFYSHTRRIWLKTLWWYIHLGWQGSVADTYEVLKNNTTNIISHFIERPGRGYREELFRNMMYAYSLLPEQKNKIFTSAAKLNLANCVSVEPALTEGGELAYSKRLFNEVTKSDAFGFESNEKKDIEKKETNGKTIKIHKTTKRQDVTY